METIEKIKKAYRAMAAFSFNFLILFVLLNFLASVLIFMDKNEYEIRKKIGLVPKKYFADDGRPIDNGKRFCYQKEWFDCTAYGDIPPEYVSDVLDDFHDIKKMGFVYQPWVQFSEPVYHGKKVNVDTDEMGFPLRRTINPANPERLPVVRIFVFGGSTTFGYNVSDEHTWPTYLSEELNRKARELGLKCVFEIVNYGRGFYGPSQETALFMDLLKIGDRPALAIFMDGVNWGPDEDIPQLTEKFMRRFQETQFGKDTIYDLVSVLSLGKWAKMLKEDHIDCRKKYASGRSTPPDPREKISLHWILNRFEENRKITMDIAERNSVDTLFFMQPDPSYGYSQKLFRKRSPFNEETLKRFHEGIKKQKDIIYLGGLFKEWGENKKAVIDNVHYNPGFNRFLAEKVASYIDVNALASKIYRVEEEKSTGLSRKGLVRYISK